MIRAVLDTNVFISALLKEKGSPGHLLKLWQKDFFILITSSEVVEEIERVLDYPKIEKKLRRCGVTHQDLDDFLSTLRFGAIIVKPATKVKVIIDDPSDNKFLSCALDGKAGYIVSGDAHLLKLKRYKGIEILSVANFLKLLRK